VNKMKKVLIYTVLWAMISSSIFSISTDSTYATTVKTVKTRAKATIQNTVHEDLNSNKQGVADVKMETEGETTTILAGVHDSIGSSIGDTVFNDLNGNGLQDSGEQGVNISIDLYFWDGTKLKTSSTDSNGNYRFDKLDKGIYYVKLHLSDDSRITGGSYFGEDGNTGYIELSEGQQLDDIDAGVQQVILTQIGGKVWEDTDQDGQIDSGESGISGVKTTLYSIYGSKIVTTLSEVDGSYSFQNVKAGFYYVIAEVISDYEILGNGPFGGDGNSGYLDVTSRNITDLHVGLKNISSKQIAGKVWEDQNRDGQLDVGDVGVADVTLTLYTIAGVQVATAESGAGGFYTFPNVSQGLYFITATVPDGYEVFAHGAFGSDGTTGYLSVENQNLSNVDLGIVEQQLVDADEMIVFPDANLAHALYLELGRPGESDYDPEIRSFRKGFLNSITGEVDLVNYQISNLTGIENLRNVTYLDLRLNYIRDISPLAGMTNLKTLLLSNSINEGLNFIEDLSPLVDVVHLERLDLAYNNIYDISELSGMTQMRFLTLKHNQISDLNPLRNMINMSTLNLQNNLVTDVSPLVDMNNLQLLSLTWNQISVENRSVLSHLGIYQLIQW